MAGRYFDIPFARDGDRVSTPDDIQLDGSVSYVEGFGFDYERPAIDPVTGQPDPLYKPIPRDGWNGLLYDVTEALGIIQRQGFADWTVDAVPYEANSWVRHNGGVWYAQVPTSGEPGISPDWVSVPLPSSRYAVATGAANAYAATYQPSIAALADGMELSFRVPAANTGTSTLNINGLGAKAVRGLFGALQGGELAVGGTARVIYNQPLDAFVLAECGGGALQVPNAVQSQQAITRGQVEALIAAIPRGVSVAKTYFMGQN